MIIFYCKTKNLLLDFDYNCFKTKRRIDDNYNKEAIAINFELQFVDKQ